MRRGRTGVQLKDKWRNLIKFQHVGWDEAGAAAKRRGGGAGGGGGSKRKRGEGSRSTRAAARCVLKRPQSVALVAG